MSAATHGLTLSTTETPRPSRPRRPALTVERAVKSAPRNIPYSGVTLEPIAEDEDEAAGFVATLRADWIQHATAEAERTIQRVRNECATQLARVERSFKYGPKDGRAGLAHERKAWISQAEETIQWVRDGLAKATTPQRALVEDTRKPGVYVKAEPGMAMNMALVEAGGLTMVVRVAGDQVLQERVLTFLHELQDERATPRGVR